MKYKKYPSYKDSGVEWLGEIPSDWVSLKHKYMSKYNKGKNPKILLDEEIKHTIKYLSMDYLRGKANALFGLIEDSSYIVKEKQPLLIWDGSNAGEFVLGEHGILSSTMAAAKITNKSLFNQYYWYSCKTIEPEMRKHSNGMGIPHVNGTELRDISLPLPTYIEQQQIAKFLDNATQKMDTLIQKQENLIKLLKEKRQAVISHAVTRGLNPDVKFKDSGVEWLGEVPEHWGVYKLKYAVKKIGDIDHDMPKSISSGKPYLMTGDILDKASLIDFSKTKKISEEDFFRLSRKIKPNKGDIIFARYATIGTVCYVDIEKDFLVSYSCVTIKPMPEKILGQYLFYFLKSDFFLEEIKSYINSNTQGNVGIDSLYKTILIIPQLEEQLQILDYIKNKTQKIDKLIKKATKSIKLLKEKRTALISAAVTGKIDVRELV